VICPGCRTRVSEDAFVCEACNTVLDTSFLGAGITNEAAPAPAAEAQATRVGKVPAQEPRRTAPPVATAAPAPAATNDGAKKKFNDLMENAAAPPEASQALDDMVAQFKALPKWDRLTMGAALATLVSMALPWRWAKADGDTIGLFTEAWACALFALFVIGGIVARRHPLARPFRVAILGGSVFFSALGLLSVAGFAQGAEKVKRLHGVKAGPVIEAHAQFGLYLGAIAVLVMLAGATMTLVRRHEQVD
jgi:hypothetical protein